jgi:hypothetical protein
MDVMLAVVMTFFLKFHIRLLLDNKTTIENLEKKSQPFKSPFDLGSWDNFI